MEVRSVGESVPAKRHRARGFEGDDEYIRTRGVADWTPKDDKHSGFVKRKRGGLGTGPKDDKEHSAFRIKLEAA